MKRRQFLAATGVASVTTLAGCGGGSGTPTVAAEDVAATITVAEDNSFDPPIVNVEPGSAVEWDNQAGEERQIRANTEPSNSVEWEFEVDLEDGETGRFVFEDEGVYGYHEAEETWFRMCGAVTVGDFSEEDVGGLPCER